MILKPAKQEIHIKTWFSIVAKMAPQKIDYFARQKDNKF